MTSTTNEFELKNINDFVQHLINGLFMRLKSLIETINHSFH